MNTSLANKSIATAIYNTVKRLALSFVLTLATIWAQAQEVRDPAIQMADGMRANGKIYVVVAVLLTVLVGLFIYVIRLDRKISKLEKQSH
jgi:uncharacterized membrane protein (DUF485 family)